jgi:signal transduction histidine kinase
MLAAIWIILVGWQAAEHNRVRRSARAALINRAKDISNTLGLIMRSQRRFGGVISKERLEPALNELTSSGELRSIALLNKDGEEVAAAGAPIDSQVRNELQEGELWEEQTVTLENLVDLGTNVTKELESTNLTLVMARSEIFQPFTNRPPPPPPEFDTNSPPSSTNGPPPRPRGFNFRRQGTNSGVFERPYWMKEEDFKSMIQKKGVHSFIFVMSAASVQAVLAQDLWLRSIIAILGTVSVAGIGVAWRTIAKSSELQIRLVRASELNTHLKQMNLAAAGLAHETRNPLNIIRGQAQMLSKLPDSSPDVRKQCRDIIDEADRVTAQLNEFINYSRPREVRYAAVALEAVTAEVVRALSHDIEEKNINLRGLEEHIVIRADEQLLRQALFNLLLNATQVVDAKGEIQVVTRRTSATEACLEVRDNGPGVPAENRQEIFKPYFTTQKKGTGLGLALVQQIVLAHEWEVEVVPNEPRGAVFRVTHIKLSPGG